MLVRVSVQPSRPRVTIILVQNRKYQLGFDFVCVLRVHRVELREKQFSTSAVGSFDTFVRYLLQDNDVFVRDMKVCVVLTSRVDERVKT